MILVIDNYDSFVETLARYVRREGEETRVVRNDQATVEQLLALEPDGIILSPGPGRPESGGIMCDLIRAATNVPVLGVCLGYQALVRVYGGKTVHATEPMHGRATRMVHADDPFFKNVPSPFEAGRYHSLIGEMVGSDCLQPIAWTEANSEVMGVRHISFRHVGVQFHPESLLTPHGRTMIQNFLLLCLREANL